MKKTKSKEWNYKFSTWIYGLFDTILLYKSQALGKTVIKIDPAYTSQTCFLCGHVDRNNRKQEKFVCRGCGYTAHADFNASCTILEKGAKITGCSQSAQQVHNLRRRVLESAFQNSFLSSDAGLPALAGGS